MDKCKTFVYMLF